MCFKAEANVTDGITTRNLSKQEMEQLIMASQILGVPITFVFLHQFVELVAGYEVNYLSEDVSADVHNSAILSAKLLGHFKSKNQRTITNV